MDEIIEQYYELSNYGSIDKILKLLKLDDIKIPRKLIKEYLDNKEEVQILKEDKQTKTHHKPIIAMEPNEILCIDIFVLDKYKKVNRGYTYILAIIDVFTRKAYCVAMKSKNIIDVTTGLKLLMKENDLKPMLYS